MPWPGISLQFPLLLLAATIGPPGVRTEGNVGCLFSERLCLEDEWCYDDYAFGRCLRPISDVDEDDIFRYNLKREELHALKQELQRLFALGYRWSHGYTQCRLQAMLYANKHDLPSDADACSHLVDQDLEGALNAMEGQDPLDPNEMAIIKYMPSEEDPNAIYADEVYYPPVDEVGRVAALREKIYPSNAEDILDMEDPLAQYEIMKREWIPQMHRRSVPTAFLNAQESGLGGQEVEEPLAFLPGLPSYDDTISDNDYVQNYDLRNDDNTYLTLQEMRDMYPLLKFLNKMQLTPADLRRVLSPENYQTLERMLEEYEDSAAKNEEKLQDLLNLQLDNNDIPAERFTLTYNTPDSFRAGLETRDGMNSEDYPESRVYFDENEDYAEERGSGQHQYPPVEIFRELKNTQLSDDYRLTGHDKADGYIRNIFRHGGPNFDHTAQGFEKFQGPGQKRLGENRHSNSNPGIYTEGGVVYGPDSRSTTGQSSQHVQHDDWNYNLDNLLEKYKLGFKRPERLDVKKPGPPFNTRTTEDAKKTSYVNEDNMILPSMMKKGPRGAPHPYPHKPDFYDMDDSDSDYVYVGFNKDFKTWGQGQDIIRNISSLLHLEPSNFENGHVIGNIVTFKVLPNSRGLNASEVAKRVYSIKDVLTADTGLRVIEAGIKDREKMQAVLSAPIMNNNEFYIVIFMVCGVLGAMIIAAALLILIRRHIRSKEKLQNLGRPDTEASKDYQDLCRVRMASKGQPTSENAPGRITSLSKESEQSPSSRSSTSSWSEEPALHNMDISTGHMVLSYMEDHLKNKDRLEQEWVALCAYVAEPCETTIATKTENSEKNRYPEIIPYNHSRVVLNELSNAASWDYINASSITDHDPRNPAYIATQGPLPHTSADFWQLIWEQGAVVIVMLTRLTESGSAMCHRYWPEEGSELYHIYEVHLVSEHIWCDDYLVRSFYLKNARTGETRTVTQFHFLSWPETGVPASTKALLEFRRKVNKSYRGRSCPIVVHCSDGAGRTGTYCLIDMVLSRMAKGAKEIDIAATLEHLRDQRPKMVATKQQFEFVLTAVAEEVHAILKALPPQPANQAPEKEK